MRQFAFTSDAAAADDAQYRIIVSGETLYISFQVLADDTLPSPDAQDAVYFGMTNGSAAGARLFVVFPERDAGTVFANAPAAGTPSDSPRPHEVASAHVSWYSSADITVADPTWALQATPATGLSDAAYWEGKLDTTPSTGSPGAVWAVTLKVDLAALGVTGAMKMFFGVRIGNSAGVVRLGSSLLAATDALAISDGTNPSIVPRTTSGWVNYVDPGTACSGNIEVLDTLVGVWNGVSLTNAVQACSAPACTPTTNKFRVTVQNVPDVGSNHSVRMKIRFADWGSTIANWKFAPWNEIPGFTPNVFTVPQATLDGDSSWHWDTAPGAPGFVNATIDYTCNVQPGERYCPKLTNPDNEAHQCMLVEVAGSPDYPWFRFSAAAVYRNMDFNGLSTLSRAATVSIQGLKALTGKDVARNVYLYVTTVNMPPHGDQPVFADAGGMQITRLYAEHPPALSPRQREPNDRQPRPELKRAAAAKPPEPQGPATPVLHRDVKSIYELPVLSPEQALSTAWPMYKVYVYYDTGETTTIVGKQHKLLQPMVPFGFYLSHDGPLYGFTHALAAEGVTLERVADNFFKVLVPSEGSFKAKVTVSAEEKPVKGPAPCPPCKDCKHGICDCRLVGAPGVRGSGYAWLGALLAGTLLLRRQRRRSGAGRESRP